MAMLFPLASVVMSLIVFLGVSSGLFASPMLISVIIMVLLSYTIHKYGLISIESIMLIGAYLPSSAFFYADLMGAKYINYHEHYLQDDKLLVSQALSYILVSFSFTMFLMSFMRSSFATELKLKPEFTASKSIYIVSLIGSTFFFWLTDPYIGTIFTHSYTDILQERIEGTQYAGALGLIFWLISYLQYNMLRKRHRKSHYLVAIFYLLTIASIVWLVLHSRRSELLGIMIILILHMRHVARMSNKIILAAVLISLLTLVGLEIVRANVTSRFMDNIVSSEYNRDEIQSLPGGMSNVFITFVESVHYFNEHDYLYGETYMNYLMQLMPSNLYSYLGINKPETFYESIINSHYSNSGGLYFLSVPYGNFGMFGSILGGALLSLYIAITIKLLSSSNWMRSVAGLFLLAISIKSFWYNIIIAIKPFVLIMVPLLILSYSLKKFPGSLRYRKIGSHQ